jgi:hypothetical protein
MSTHLCIYNTSAKNTSYASVPAITNDPVMSLQNNHYLMDTDRQILWALAYSANMQRARIVSPKLSAVLYPSIRPIAQGLGGPYVVNIARFLRSPIALSAGEELELDCVNSPTTTEQIYMGAAVTNGITPAPTGSVFWLRGTATTTLVANTLTQLTITWDQQPPYGIWAVVGMEAYSAGVVFARLIFTGQQDRPGVVGLNSLQTLGDRMFNADFAQGILGQFNTNQMPRCEFFSASADTSEEVYIAITRVG